MNKSFTLIEIILAIAIFSIIVTAVYSSFYVGTKSYFRLTGKIEKIQELNWFLQKLSKELRNAYLEKEDFIGYAHNLSFFTVEEVYSEEGIFPEIARVSYEFKKDKLFKKLQIGGEAFLLPQDFEFKEIMEGVNSLNFTYLYYKDLEKKEVIWRDFFEEKGILPRGVKVEISSCLKEECFKIRRFIWITQGNISKEPEE